MFCPECGQQQASPNVRFCTQCGFQLGVVSALLMQAQSPATGQLASQASRRPLLKRGAMLGATLMWIAMILASLAVRQGDEVAAFATLFWLILMLVINLFGPVVRLAKRLFAEEDPATANRYVAPRVSAPLPPLDTRTARVEPQRVNVGGPFHPPGIIEHTTRSLGREHQE